MPTWQEQNEYVKELLTQQRKLKHKIEREEDLLKTLKRQAQQHCLDTESIYEIKYVSPQGKVIGIPEEGVEGYASYNAYRFELFELVQDPEVFTKDEQPNQVNKYDRKLYSKCGKQVTVDVYSVLDAFQTSDAALDHAIKKLLCSGLRGHKDSIQDKKEAIEAIQRSIEIEESKCDK